MCHQKTRQVRIYRICVPMHVAKISAVAVSAMYMKNPGVGSQQLSLSLRSRCGCLSWFGGNE